MFNRKVKSIPNKLELEHYKQIQTEGGRNEGKKTETDTERQRGATIWWWSKGFSEDSPSEADLTVHAY